MNNDRLSKLEASQAASGANGHATKAEHEELREVVDGIRDEQERQGKQLDFIEGQMGLFGQAMELLLQERGLEMPGSDDDD